MTDNESLFNGIQVYIGYKEATSSIQIVEPLENMGRLGQTLSHPLMEPKYTLGILRLSVGHKTKGPIGPTVSHTLVDTGLHRIHRSYQ